MKMYVIRILAFLLMNTLIYATSTAQDCARNLEEAQRAYYNGQFDLASDLLRGCIDETDVGNKTVDALEIYIKSQLLLDQQEEAQDYMKKLLSNYPNYEPGYQDLIIYTELVEKFEVKPKISYHLSLGTNLPFYQIMKYHSYGSETIEPTAYDGSPGLSIGGGSRFYFTEMFSVDVSTIFQSTRYRQTEFLQDYLNVSIDERMYFLSIPVSINYSKRIGELVISAGLGMVGHYRLASIADFQVIPTQSVFLFPFIGVPQLESGYNLSDQRKSFTYGYTGFVEGTKSYNKNSFFFNIAYEYGLNNQVKTGDRYTIPFIKENLSYVPDDFKYDAIRISMGYRRTIFKVEKR